MASANDPRSLKDDELVAAFKLTRENRYFEEIHARHARNIYRRVYSFLNERHPHAPDLTQDVFLRAFEHIDTYAGGSLSAWLSTIAKHLCISFMKSAAVRRETTVVELPEPIPEEHAELRSLEVLTAINQLSAPQRNCIKLWAEGYSYVEIAGLIGIAAEAVRSHIQNGKLRLRQKEVTRK
jgi:RNA polymerase sigma-70 factor (ECF subfamily)